MKTRFVPLLLLGAACASAHAATGGVDERIRIVPYNAN
jgi:hypothetical protein